MLTFLVVMGTTLMGPFQETRGTERAASSEGTSASTDRWTPLFNGRDLTGWYTFLQKHGKNSDPDHVITIEDGAIHLYKDAPEGSNVVMGYIGTEKEYENYHI